MSDPDPLDTLVAEFANAHAAGANPDISDFLERVSADQRQELAQMLDSFLMGTTQRRPWNPEGYEASLAKLAVDRVHESAEGVSGSWPELLPRLRAQARIRRREVVERLAGGLGLGKRAEVEKIGFYYHRMEHGTLPSAGVSGRVIEALAEVLGASGEEIIRAGRASGGSGSEGDVAFARTAIPDLAYGDPPEPGAAKAPARREPDEIDALFLDG